MMMASIWAPAWMRAIIAPPAGDPWHADHLDLRVPRFRRATYPDRQEGACRELGIERIRLAVAAAA